MIPLFLKPSFLASSFFFLKILPPFSSRFFHPCSSSRTKKGWNCRKKIRIGREEERRKKNERRMEKNKERIKKEWEQVNEWIFYDGDRYHLHHLIFCWGNNLLPLLASLFSPLLLLSFLLFLLLSFLLIFLQCLPVFFRSNSIVELSSFDITWICHVRLIYFSFIFILSPCHFPFPFVFFFLLVGTLFCSEW